MGTEIFATVGFILILVIILYVVPKPKPITPEQLLEQEKELKKKEKDLARIYWHIAEIDRISKEKTKAIQAGDMELYKKLVEEHTALNALYKIEFPEKD